MVRMLSNICIELILLFAYCTVILISMNITQSYSYQNCEGFVCVSRKVLLITDCVKDRRQIDDRVNELAAW